MKIRHKYVYNEKMIDAKVVEGEAARQVKDERFGVPPDLVTVHYHGLDEECKGFRHKDYSLDQGSPYEYEGV